jgi:hypothetical protein
MRDLVGFVLVLALGVMGCGETAGDPSVCDNLEAFECIDEPACTPVMDLGYSHCAFLSEEKCAEQSATPEPEHRQGFCAEWYPGYFGFSSPGETMLCRQDSDCPVGKECSGTPLGECQDVCVLECGEGVECPEGQACEWRQPGCGHCSVITGWCWDGITAVCKDKAP